MRKYLLRAIALKVASAFLFAVMSALVRFLGENYPVGQIVFFRSAAAVLPVRVTVRSTCVDAWKVSVALAVLVVNCTVFKPGAPPPGRVKFRVIAPSIPS